MPLVYSWKGGGNLRAAVHGNAGGKRCTPPIISNYSDQIAIISHCACVSSLYREPSLHFQCPELALAYAQRQRRTNDNYTREQCDLWSFGCTLYFVATGMFPFPIDAKDSNVYAQAVAEQSRPQG